MIADPLVESVPESELGGRKPARKPLSAEQKEKANARARERRAQGGGGARRPRGRPRTARGPVSLYAEISAFLSLANMLVVVSPLGSRTYVVPGTDGNPATVEQHIGDELDEAEIDLLAKSLDAQCQRSPRFRKQIERILGVGAAGGLLGVIGMIVIRRAARHGILPPAIDMMMGGVMDGGDLGAMASFTPPVAPDQSADPTTGERPPQPSPELDDDGQPVFSYEGA